MSIAHVREYLSQFGLQDRIQEFDVSSATVELAAQALNTQPGRIAKTLSFMAGEQPLLIVMAGDARVDNRKFKDLFHVKAKMMSAQELEQFTGLHFGGVCPFGIPKDVHIYLDESLRRYELIYPACGTSNSAIGLTPAELESCCGCVGWIDVAKKPENTCDD